MYSSNTKNWFHTQLRLCLCKTSQGSGSDCGYFSRSPALGSSPRQHLSHEGNRADRRARVLHMPEQHHPFIWAASERHRGQKQSKRLKNKKKIITTKKGRKAEMSKPSGFYPDSPDPLFHQKAVAVRQRANGLKKSQALHFPLLLFLFFSLETQSGGNSLHFGAKELRSNLANGLDGKGGGCITGTYQKREREKKERDKDIEERGEKVLSARFPVTSVTLDIK